MKVFLIRKGFLCLNLLIAIGTLPAQTVKSMTASMRDIAAQQKRDRSMPEVAEAIRQYKCQRLADVPPPPKPMMIPRHYLTGSNGPVNPTEQAMTKRYSAFENRVVGGADQWLATGNEKEASCALDQLDVWAQDRALLDYDVANFPQSWYQVEWTLSSIGIANSILVNDSRLDQSKQKRVNQWLDDVAKTMMQHDKPHGNNHHYWRGLAAISVGVSVGDNELFRQALEAYKDGIQEIDSRGALPKEMVRHENAIHYQGFAVEPLILIAEFAAQQGVDLYSYTSHGKTLRDALVFLGRAVEDPSLVAPYNADPQKLNFTDHSFPAEAFYVARFGNEGLSSLITSKRNLTTWESRYGGSPIVFLAGH